eukprot:Lankesteria_metandrocarpae@DN778_c0_g1_i1.p1
MDVVTDAEFFEQITPVAALAGGLSKQMLEVVVFQLRKHAERNGGIIVLYPKESQKLCRAFVKFRLDNNTPRDAIVATLLKEEAVSTEDSEAISRTLTSALVAYIAIEHLTRLGNDAREAVEQQDVIDAVKLLGTKLGGAFVGEEFIGSVFEHMTEIQKDGPALIRSSRSKTRPASATRRRSKSRDSKSRPASATRRRSKSRDSKSRPASATR